MNENLFRWSKMLRSPLFLGCCGCNSYRQAGRTARNAVALSFHSIHGQKVPKKRQAGKNRQTVTDTQRSVFSLYLVQGSAGFRVPLRAHMHTHVHTRTRTHRVARARVANFPMTTAASCLFSAGRCGCPFASRGFFLGRVRWSILIRTSDTIFYSVGHNSSG